MKLKKLVYGAMVATMLISTGCASEQAETPVDKPTETEHQGHEEHQQPAAGAQPVKLNDKQVKLPNGDIQETTASADQLPTFLTTARAETREAYRIAVKHTDILQSIPCYCGCGVSANHKNNMQCFIKEVKPDKTIVWDDHGTRRATCMNIAITSAKLKESGKTVKEIRSIIDNQYKQGYSKPTPTPMPS